MLDVQTAGSRLAEGYEPRWDIDRAVGLRGELHALSIREAFAQGSVEVKTDERAADTRHVFVEYECNGRPSGVATTEAMVWAFIIGDRLVAVPADTLLTLARKAYENPRNRVECVRGSHPTKGVRVRVSHLAGLP